MSQLSELDVEHLRQIAFIREVGYCTEMPKVESWEAQIKAGRPLTLGAKKQADTLGMYFYHAENVAKKKEAKQLKKKQTKTYQKSSLPIDQDQPLFFMGKQVEVVEHVHGMEFVLYKPGKGKPRYLRLDPFGNVDFSVHKVTNRLRADTQEHLLAENQRLKAELAAHKARHVLSRPGSMGVLHLDVSKQLGAN